jgi:hypothetical protein
MAHVYNVFASPCDARKKSTQPCRTPKTPERRFMTAYMNKEKGNVNTWYYAGLEALRNR